MDHLDELEAEAIYIMREVAAECERPVMLYSIGKDSSVMLRLAMKAFYPEKPPFPFLHVNTTWKFREMIEFRDATAKELGIEMLEYINEEGVSQGINPFEHGSSYTDIMKTQALKQALDKYGFTAAFGAGAGMRKNLGQKSGYFPSAMRAMHGTLRTKGRKCGSCSIQRLNKGRVSGCSHCPIGQRRISGSILKGKISQLYRYILPRHGQLLPGMGS